MGILKAERNQQVVQFPAEQKGVLFNSGNNYLFCYLTTQAIIL